MREDGHGWNVPRPIASRRVSVLLAAALLFAAVFAVGVVEPAKDNLVSFLYALPIAMVAVELGLAWGLAAAALALGLFRLWDVTDHTFDGDLLDYVSLGASFLILGGVAGAFADRLRRASADSARLWELSTDLICTVGFDGYFRRLNAAWEQTLGWTPRELRSQPSIELVHPDDRARTKAEEASLTRAGHETHNFENRYRCKDGTYRTLLWGARSIPEERLTFATARDVTDRKGAEEKFRGVLESAPDAMVIVDKQGEIQMVNAETVTLFGYPREELIGQAVEILMPERYRSRHTEHRVGYRSQPRGRPMGAGPELRGRSKDGREFPLEISLSPLETDQGLLVTAALRDITERKLVEQAADAARAEAERANRAKSEFLSRMSHELRTPLNAVIGFAQLLELDDLDARQSASAEQILRAGRHLLELINEVLDIARIESGSMSVSLEPVHLGGVLSEALSLIQPLADEAAVSLTGDPGSGAEIYVLGDRQRLKQVLINLLSNAVKYNRRGGAISVQCTERPDTRVEVAIADTGTGIAADKLERLFDPFDRLGAERTGIEGTGLGLALSMQLTQAMGGTITAESQPGTGTTMRVELDRGERPEDAAPTPRGALPKASGSPRGTIVYMEDNLSNVKLVERLIERLPEVRLIPAMQGELGIGLARHHHPDLILLDLHLPDLAGHDVLRRLKDDPLTAAIPVVILSADVAPGQVARFDAAGASAYVTKPIDIELFLNTITGTLRRATPSEGQQVGR